MVQVDRGFAFQRHFGNALGLDEKLIANRHDLAICSHCFQTIPVVKALWLP